MGLGGQGSDLLGCRPEGAIDRGGASASPEGHKTQGHPRMLTSGLEEVRDRHECGLEVGLCWDQRQDRRVWLGIEGFLGPLEEQLRPSPVSVLP